MYHINRSVTFKLNDIFYNLQVFRNELDLLKTNLMMEPGPPSLFSHRPRPPPHSEAIFFRSSLSVRKKCRRIFAIFKFTSLEQVAAFSELFCFLVSLIKCKQFCIFSNVTVFIFKPIYILNSFRIKCKL